MSVLYCASYSNTPIKYFYYTSGPLPGLSSIFNKHKLTLHLNIITICLIKHIPLKPPMAESTTGLAKSLYTCCVVSFWLNTRSVENKMELDQDEVRIK